MVADDSEAVGFGYDALKSSRMKVLLFRQCAKASSDDLDEIECSLFLAGKRHFVMW